MKINFLNTTLEITEDLASTELILNVTSTKGVNETDVIRFSRKDNPDEAMSLLLVLEEFLKAATKLYQFEAQDVPDYVQVNGENLVIPVVDESK